ncbi:MarR family transcriptional regulator [Streptomyces shenzhenensis]|uniref:MarR family transcriptional regulator n=1 Tax=Streptomyces shenzhenensis TaxID=943815 RepID=UPI0015F07AA1|nr:MarR family transcriptional regulator [Streptomyces shenzhenensis]
MPAFDVLDRALTECRRDGVTGRLSFAGSPGAVFHMRQGFVVAVDSPGAPGPDALLLRSGRISEADWTAALRAAAESRTPQAELVARGSVGTTELQVLCLMAVQDAAFATAAGTIEGYAVDDEPAEILFPAVDGIDPGLLLHETERRLSALARFPVRLSPYRQRVAPAPGIDVRDHALTPGRREILACTDGRRCARDIAFRISRSVYSVTVEISRMLSEGLVVEVAPGARQHVTSETGALEPPARGRPIPGPDDGDRPRDLLPLRRRGASGIDEAPDKTRTSGWEGLPRLLARMRSSPVKAPADADQGDTGNQKGS